MVELAGVCGLDLLPDRRPDPLGASTYGLGQVLAHAITHGATDIVLGIGGVPPPTAAPEWSRLWALGCSMSKAAIYRPGGAALQNLASLD